MGGFQRFENRLEQAISGVFAKAFRSAVQPVEISAALEREVDNNAQILSRNRRLVPNVFVVELSEADLDRLSAYDEAMADELTHNLREHAENQAYVFPGPLSISFERADDLSTGRFRVRSRAQARVTSNDSRGQGGRGQGGRTRVVLDVNGSVHAVHPPGIVVGRGTDADIRINDPGVSRRHAEFGVELGRRDDVLRIAVRDLGSTNGLLVDGVKVAQSPLEHGSTVKIGSTTMTVRVLDAADEVDDG